jgi:hypothetical protein
MNVGQVVKGLWYPEMPPMLGDEDIDHYTNRLTGALGYELCPYDHRRNRQCSIGCHDECSDPRGERCKCPCHQGGSTEETVAAAVLRSAVATIVAESATKPVVFTCGCGQRWRIEPAPSGGRVAEEQRHPVEWEAWRWE